MRRAFIVAIGSGVLVALLVTLLLLSFRTDRQVYPFPGDCAPMQDEVERQRRCAAQLESFKIIYEMNDEVARYGSASYYRANQILPVSALAGFGTASVIVLVVLLMKQIGRTIRTNVTERNRTAQP